MECHAYSGLSCQEPPGTFSTDTQTHALSFRHKARLCLRDIPFTAFRDSKEIKRSECLSACDFDLSQLLLMPSRRLHIHPVLLAHLPT